MLHSLVVNHTATSTRLALRRVSQHTLSATLDASRGDAPDATCIMPTAQSLRFCPDNERVSLANGSRGELESLALHYSAAPGETDRHKYTNTQ